MRSACRLFLPCVLVCAALPAVSQEQQFANLGDFKLESGEVLRDCRIGYRTAGTMNADKSNIIVIPTWAGGKTEQWVPNVGPGKVNNISNDVGRVKILGVVFS